MIAPPERSPERDVALEALLDLVPLHGWTVRSLRMALGTIGADPDDAPLLFPGGAPDMVEAFSDLSDRRMIAAVEALDLTGYGLSARVRTAIMQRLERNRLHKDAVRRAVALLSLPRNAALAARCTARTVDAIWHAAGDHSADFSWYTKRALLAGVYGSTLLFWLRDTSEEDAETRDFLDRRLGDVRRIGQLRGKIQRGFGWRAGSQTQPEHQPQ